MRNWGIIVSALLVAQVGIAQSSTSETSTAPVGAAVPTKKWGVTAIVSTATNLRGSDDLERSLSNEYTLSPSYKISDKITLSAVGIFSHDLIQEEESELQNSKIKASYKALSLVQDVLTFSPAISATAPTNKKSREENSLVGAASIEPSLSLEGKKWGIPASISYAFAATRNFHEFYYSNTGSPNTQYSFKNALALGIELGKNFSIGGGATLLSGITYDGAIKSKFEIAEELGYQVTEQFGVAIGHSNSGSTLKSDYQTSNVELFNETTSSVYGSLQVVY